MAPSPLLNLHRLPTITEAPLSASSSSSSIFDSYYRGSEIEPVVATNEKTAEPVVEPVAVTDENTAESVVGPVLEPDPSLEAVLPVEIAAVEETASALEVNPILAVSVAETACETAINAVSQVVDVTETSNPLGIAGAGSSPASEVRIPRPSRIPVAVNATTLSASLSKPLPKLPSASSVVSRTPRSATGSRIPTPKSSRDLAPSPVPSSTSAANKQLAKTKDAESKLRRSPSPVFNREHHEAMVTRMNKMNEGDAGYKRTIGAMRRASETSSASPAISPPSTPSLPEQPARGSASNSAGRSSTKSPRSPFFGTFGFGRS